METITLENDHGTFEVSAMKLDRTMARHLPASPEMLRVRLELVRPGDYSDVHTVAEFLVMLAHWSYEWERMANQP